MPTAQPAPTFKHTGFLHDAGATQQVTDKFKKREFVLNVLLDGHKHPEQIKFTLVQHDVDLLDAFQAGDKLDVTFLVRGRAYPKNGEVIYYNTLEVTKLAPNLY